MLRRSLLSAVLFCIVLTCATAKAQNLCPAGVQSDKLICLIPQVYGANGLVLARPVQIGDFQDNFLSSDLRPLNAAVARQSALRPLASPSSGITFSWDPAAKVFTPSTDSFGPILGERAETIGKYKVFLGLDYQYFKFGSIDGVDLKQLPVVFTQQDDSAEVVPPTPPGTTCSVNAPDPVPGGSVNENPSRSFGCGFIRDVIKTSNRLDLKIHQFTTFVTFGLTNRIDVSVAIPVQNVRMGILSTATIVPNSKTRVHVFSERADCSSPCLHRSFSGGGTASGIGDLTLRVKGTVWKSAPKSISGKDDLSGTKPGQGERAALALGVDVRMPTGDQLNFLGAGAYGVKPFVVWSYRSKFSPHIFVGFETNGSSLIAGDISVGAKARLPGQLTYSCGADVWLTKWFTTAFDLVGQQVFEARRTSVITFTEPGACQDARCIAPFETPNTDPTLAQSTGTFNITNASVGVKMRPFSALLITGNALIKLNDGGLRATAVPLLGVSYTF